MDKILIYGASLSGKTTTVYYYLKWKLSLEENKGKRAIVVSMDGGSNTFWHKTDISDKLLIVTPFDSDVGLAMFRKICRGYVLETGTLKVKKLNLEKYCVIVVDSWTGFATASLEKLRSDENLPDMLATGKPLMEAGERFGGNSKSHYGVIHNEIKKVVDIELPRLGLDIISTALVEEGEESVTKQARYGPATCGSAIVSKMPSWFEDTFLQERVEKKVKLEDGKIIRKTEHRLWFTGKEDKNTGIPYISGVRCLPTMAEKLNKEFPNGFVKVNEEEGLKGFYRVKYGI